MAKSPAIILTEKSESSFAVTNSDTILAVLGYATKGPINKVTLVTSKNEFKETFGTAPNNAPWSHLAVYRAFNQGNQVYYTRIADSTASESMKVIRNDSAATSGYQTFSFLYSIPDGAYLTNTPYAFNVAVDGGSVRPVYINSPSGGDWSSSNIATKINAFLTQESNGFQEFLIQSNPAIPTLNKEYRYTLSMNSSSVATGEDLSVFLNPSDTLSSIATKISNSIYGGSYGFQTITNAGITGEYVAAGIATGTYDMEISVDGGVSESISVSVVNTTDTWGSILTRIKTAISLSTILQNKVTVSIETGIMKFQSNTQGASSTILLAAGSVDLIDAIATGSIPGGSTADTEVDGVAGLTNNFLVEKNSETLRIRIISTTGTAGTVSIEEPAIGTSLLDLLGDVGTSTVGSDASTATSSVASNKVKVISDATGISSSILLTEKVIASGFGNFLAIENVDADTAVAGVAQILFSTKDNIFFTSKEKGTATSGISLIKSSSTDPVSGSTINKIVVYYNGIIKETFSGISLDTASDDYFVTKINNDSQNGGSSLISVEVTRPGGATGNITFPNGTYTLGSGTVSYPTEGYDYKSGVDGIPSSDIRSSATQLFVTALGTDGELANTEEYDFHILITPDNGSQAVQDAAITLAEYRADFVYIADTPQSLTYSQAVGWHNGEGYGRETAINSSYSAVYWDWLKDYNENNGEYVWCPPSVFIAELLMKTDRIYAPWYAAAGDVRGRITASDYASSPSFPQREVLYGDLNCINPIVNFSSKGLEVYGNKTAVRSLTDPLNRLHIRRMANYIKKLVKVAMEGIVFEPHNAASWARATNLINAILEPIRQDNGLDDYRVTIDSSTNTEDLIAQGIMRGIIKLVPVGAIEIIDLTITFLNPGATITE